MNNNNYNLPQVPPPVYYPSYDRPPPYNPEYIHPYPTYPIYPTNQVAISNSHNFYPSQFYNQPTHIQIANNNDKNTNNDDKSCFYIFLGALCCCCLMEEENY